MQPANMDLNRCSCHSFWNTNSFLALQIMMILCHITSSQNLPAQSSSHPTFIQYTSDNGLPSSEVYDVIQDRNGYIWISTDNGVSRFDGYEFHNYGPREGLRENVIFTMQLDSLGRVWMQANNGELFYTDHDSIKPYWNNAVLLQYPDRPDYAKGFIVEGSGETIHVSTLKYGVISISKNGHSTTYGKDSTNFRQIFSISNNSIYAQLDWPYLKKIHSNIESNLSTPECTKILFIDNSYIDTEINISNSTISNIQTFRVAILSNNMQLIQMNDSILYIYNKRIQWRRKFTDIILDAHLLPNGKIILGLGLHKGVLIFPSIDAVKTSTGKHWLWGKTVSDIFIDKDESLWLATNEHGIFYSPKGTPLIDDLVTGLPDEIVNSIAIKDKDEIFAGLNNGEIILLKNNEPYTPIVKLPSSQRIRDILYDRSLDQLWIGGDYLYLLRNNSLVLKEFTYENRQYSMGNRITMSKPNDYKWICSYSGFMGMDHSTLPEVSLPSFSGRAYIAREDHAGRVWVGKSEGLFEWKDSTLLDRTKLHPAFSLRVEDLEQMSDSTLVVATKGGGVVFWKGNQFEQLTTNDGLTANMIECLHADKYGNLWVGTLNGLNQISGPWKNRKVKQFTKFNGLPSNEINKITSSDDIVWVATNKGLAHFSSNRSFNTDAPKPIITSIQANGIPVKIARKVEVGWKENNVTIAFLAINFKMNGHIQYRYRIDGGDWAMMQSRSLNFPKLPSGEQLFELQAQNEDEIWSPSTSLLLNIRPPWWNTWWAKSSGILILLLIGYKIYKYNTNKIINETRIQHQILELERSALQAQMNPHFIFNCLNSIQNYIVQNDKDLAIQYLGRFASLTRSTLNASVAGKVSLAEEINLLNNYLELEKLRFTNRFTFEILTSKELDIHHEEIPPLLIQPYVENAILHGISKRKHGGIITVSFSKHTNYLIVNIQDNGPGLNNQDDDLITSGLKKSFGMSITKNRLDLLSGKDGKNNVEVKNITDPSGNIQGTNVCIQLNLNVD